MDIKSTSPYRQYIVGINNKVPVNNGQLLTYINFDNAATTPPLKSVLKAINDFAPWYSSIHRGQGYKSLLSSNLYEESRQIILQFVGGDRDYHTVIYVKNSSEALNKLANRLNQSNHEKDLVLSSEMEHHSNDLPWRKNFSIDYVKVNKRGQLSLDDLERKLYKYKDRIRLVTVTGASNVTGYLNPIYQIARLVHQYDAELLVDGAQLIPHQIFKMKSINDPEHIDYLVFSAHKIYAPFGTGVLIGPKKTFQQGYPDYMGGGTIKVVTPKEVYWDDPPHKDEAGTPNIMGVIALIEALKTIKKIGLEKIAAYEKKLAEYTYNRLKKLPGILLYNKIHQQTATDQPFNNRVAIIPFNIKSLSHEKLAEKLAGYGVAVRNGCFCAQPYVQKLLNVSSREIRTLLLHPERTHPGLVRISFGMYNEKAEVDIMIDSLQEIINTQHYPANNKISMFR